MSVYLDYQAAKPVDPRVLSAMRPYYNKIFANPASLHFDGDDATNALQESRQKIADFINAPSPDSIIFTSSATEASNLGLIGAALNRERKGNHIIISEIEHISILNLGKYLERQGFEVSRVGVDKFGVINIEKLKRLIRENTILISIASASNEVGSLQPIAEISEIAQEKDILFHTDAVAIENVIPIDDKIPEMSLSLKCFKKSAS